MSSPQEQLSPSILRHQGFDLDALIAAQNRNIETFQEVGSVVADGLRLVGRRQAELLEEGMKKFGTTFGRTSRLKSVEDVVKAQTDLCQRVLDTYVRQFTDIIEIAGQSHINLMGKLGDHRQASGHDEVTVSSPTRNGRPESKTGPKTEAAKTTAKK